MSAATASTKELGKVITRLPAEKVQEVIDFAVFLCGRLAKDAGKKKRPVGLYAGQGAIHPSFYEPLADDIVASFGAGKM